MVGFFQLLIMLEWTVFHSINSVAGLWRPLDWLIKLGADDHILPVVMILLVLSLLLLARDHDARERALRCVLCALAAVALATVLLYTFNAFFFRPRPFTSHQVNLLFYHNTDSSFPSNPATLAFALAFITLMFKRKMGGLLVGLACFLGLARIAAGVHYPFDVIGGAVLGLGCALVAKGLEPAVSPVAGACNRVVDRALCAWEVPGRAGEGERG